MASRFDKITDWEKEARQADYDPVAVAEANKATLRSLEHYFRRLFHECPHAWFTRLKLEDSKPLVEQGLPIHEVSDRFGYHHSTAFVAAFKHQFGLTPRQHFRKTRDAKTSPFLHFPSLAHQNASEIVY
jgi:AraC-like DNA-binding protein